jgi:hypothetical protein
LEARYLQEVPCEKKGEIMVDIKTIKDAELKQDLDDIHKDIKDCEKALRERLNENKHFVKVITAEIQRRKTADN